MTANDAMNLVLTILGSAGAASVIILGLSGWLGKVWAERIMRKEAAKFSNDLEKLRSELTKDSESYKLKLRKSEILFNLELNAASALVMLHADFSPGHTRPQMEWEDACDDVALNFAHIERMLGIFVANHGAVLSSDVLQLVETCLGLAAVNKFETNGQEVSRDANRAAEKLLSELGAAKDKFLVELRSQASV